MLRDKSLIPLSRQHQHALAFCVRIDRALPVADLPAWQAEAAQLFQTEITIHFTAEERIVFPAARQFHELIPLIEDLVADHAALRETFAQAAAGKMNTSDLSDFAHRMSAHIRKEERQLFERMQALMSQQELLRMGENLEVALQDATQACALPINATRLRSATDAAAKLTEP